MFGVPDLLSVLILTAVFLVLWRYLRLKTMRARRKRIKSLLRIVDSDDHDCPICWQKSLFWCRSSCGHTYCGDCILWYWDPNEAFTPCRCLVCENAITGLNPDPTVNLNEHVEVWRNVELYNHLMVTGSNGIIQKVIASPLIFKMVFCLMKMYGDYNTNLRMVFFAVQVYMCLVFLPDSSPLTLGMLRLVVIPYYLCTAYMILRERWKTHYRRWH